MSDAPESGGRSQILAGIRRSLKRDAPSGAEAAALRQRLEQPKANLVPRRAQGLDHDGLISLFLKMAEDADASVARVARAEDVPGAVTEFLARHNLPAEAAMAPDPALDSYPWAAQPLLKIRRGRAEETDYVAITGTFAAIAETGTLMQASGPESPITLNFLPHNHVVIVEGDRVVGAMEEAWARLRESQARKGRSAMPRAVNFITGPSRTGDIEQRLQLGAHGPVRLHIIVVDRG